MGARYLVVGAGIAGLAAAVELVTAGGEVTVAEISERVGGKLRTSPFAGLAGVDEGADAYLTRVTAAVEFAATVGANSLKHPTSTHAAVWNNGLHRLPAGIMLGVPSALRPLATTQLLSWRGKARALADFVLPRTAVDDDRLGRLIRTRFGSEVHERLIDSLVGSIYAADTDNYSLAAVPQLAAIATGRSLALTARSHARRRPSSDPAAPIFAAPMTGMETLADYARSWLTENGAQILVGAAVTALEPSGQGRPDQGWRASLSDRDSELFDGVVIATPAPVAAELLISARLDPAAALVKQIEAAGVTMLRLRIPAAEWPARLRGLSGYLVPKPNQRWVTAASFGSQKWSEWRPENGDEVLRISLGRDGLPVDHLSDDQLVRYAIDDLNHQLDTDLSPTEVSITRWPAGFPQYRPYHGRLVDEIDTVLPSGIALAGASYRGIGVPACIANGQLAAQSVLAASSRR